MPKIKVTYNYVPDIKPNYPEMIESVPKEFNMDDRETTEDLYETPYEISMLRVSLMHFTILTKILM